MKRNEGFTLLELLMVIATLAVLVAVLIPNLVVSKQRAQDTQAKACLKELSTEQAVYHITNFTYADNLNNLAAYSSRVCSNINVTTVLVDSNDYEYNASHQASNQTFAVSAGEGVTTLQ